jgi:Kef-type K+ transport system membrane component KefB
VILGLLVVALTAYRLGEDELLLVLIGAVLFSGGVALYLSLSPLLVNLIAGATVANLARERARVSIRTTLFRGEQAIYVLFLIVVGAHWRLESIARLGLAALYVAVRSAAKVGGAWLSLGLLLKEEPAARRLGLGLLSHGGMAVAIVVSLQQVHPSDLTEAIISIVLVGVVVSELVSPSLVRRLLEPST